MTALGKVLVFFNLLFGLLTAGLIVLAFTARTNWRNGYEAVIQEAEAVRAAAAADRATAERQAQEAVEARKKLEEQIVELDRQIKGRDAEIANLKQQVSNSTKAAEEQLNIAQAGSTEITRLQKERDQMAQQLKGLNDELVKTRKDLADTTSRETYARLRGDALERDLSGRNEEVAGLRRKNEELRAQVPVGTTVGATPNRPRIPSVETTGQVTSSDGNYAVVSLGSDNGIEQGHVLQVYRMSPNPVYLGTLRVTRTEPHRSVGKFEPAGRGKQVAVGDTVDTKILR